MLERNDASYFSQDERGRKSLVERVEDVNYHPESRLNRLGIG
jgi:hypothetical protein